MGMLASLVLVVGLLGTCGPKPEPPVVSKINVQPSTTILEGESASLTITAAGTDLQSEWTAVRGSLSSPTTSSVIYTAPDSPGLDTVTVEVTSKGGSTVRSITFEVVPPPTPTPTPTATPTSTPTPTPTPTATPTPTDTPLTVGLSDFETGIEDWQFLSADDGCREVATDIDWSRDASQGCCSLRCGFDFTRPHCEWPHASYQIGFDESMRDWTPFGKLAFDAKSLVDSSLPVSVTVALATGPKSCWHELVDFLPVKQQWETLTFELDLPRWKACPDYDHTEELRDKNNIRRLHILVVADHSEPTGSILIDDVRLLGE
jgi:hypothetical protein